MPETTYDAMDEDCRAAYERCIAAVREVLGEERFASAWAEGQAMTLEQAIHEGMRDA